MLTPILRQEQKEAQGVEDQYAIRADNAFRHRGLGTDGMNWKPCGFAVLCRPWEFRLGMCELAFLLPPLEVKGFKQA